MSRDVGAFREVLAQQAVGVLVAATLPGSASAIDHRSKPTGDRGSPVGRGKLALTSKANVEFSPFAGSGQESAESQVLKRGTRFGTVQTWNLLRCTSPAVVLGVLVLWFSTDGIWTVLHAVVNRHPSLERADLSQRS